MKEMTRRAAVAFVALSATIGCHDVPQGRDRERAPERSGSPTATRMAQGAALANDERTAAGPAAFMPAGAEPAAGEISFTGTAAFLPSDPNADGLADALVAEVEVAVAVSGSYTLVGFLKRGPTTVIANRPSFESSVSTRARLDNAVAGATYTVSLTFSGEQIFRSGLDGPYDLDAFVLSPSVKTTIPTPALEHARFGEYGAYLADGNVREQAIDADGDSRFNYLEVTVDLLVRVEGDYDLAATLSNDAGTVTSASATSRLTPGPQPITLRLPGQPIRRAGRDGPYRISVTLASAGRSIPTVPALSTQAYPAADFDALLEPDGRFADRGVDTDGNGRFERLRVTAGVDVTEAGTYTLSGKLHLPSSPLNALAALIVPAGSQEITLEFSGPLINARGAAGDGPYQLELVAQDAGGSTELDRVTLSPVTAAYSHADFESTDIPEPPISLTGNSSDAGVDLDADGRYDELRVDVGLKLQHACWYYWSARLVDQNGTDLGFAAAEGHLPQGTTSAALGFDGPTISANRVDGPYAVDGLLIYCKDPDVSLVAIEVAVTGPYRASDFDRANRPPVADAGPDRTIDCTAATGVTEVALDGSASSDADGDPLTYSWSGPFGTRSGPQAIVTLPIGAHLVSLTVDDGYGGNAGDTVSVNVLDARPVVVSAALAPVGGVGRIAGLFEVRLGCTALHDPDPALTATLNGVAVSNEQRVVLHVSPKAKTRWWRGAPRLMKAPSFALSASCTDAQAHTAVATAAPTFR